MEDDSFVIRVEQPGLVDLQGIGANRLELISGVWDAAEAFSSPELLNRVAGLERLVTFDAVRQLPLVAYLLVNRLTEPDIELRTRIVKVLGCLEDSNQNGAGPTMVVQRTLYDQLAAMRTREIFALLQVAEYDKSTESCVANLLSGCSFAGGHLSQILTNRETPNDIRRQATYFIGILGYLDALPAIERLASRLESRGEAEDSGLLPMLQNAIQLLNTP